MLIKTHQVLRLHEHCHILCQAPVLHHRMGIEVQEACHKGRGVTPSYLLHPSLVSNMTCVA